VEAVDESVIHAEQLPAEPPPRENAQIAFFGDEQQVREGFAIALRAMGLDENLLAAGIPAPATHTNRKDN
jgi:hypothetical protein